MKQRSVDMKVPKKKGENLILPLFRGNPHLDTISEREVNLARQRIAVKALNP